MSGLVCGGVGAVAGSFALGRVSVPLSAKWLAVVRVALAVIGVVVAALGAWKVWGGRRATVVTPPAAPFAQLPVSAPAPTSQSPSVPPVIAAIPAAPALNTASAVVAPSLAPVPIPQPPSVPAAPIVAPALQPSAAPAPPPLAAPAVIAASAVPMPAPSAAPPVVAVVVASPPAAGSASVKEVCQLTSEQEKTIGEMLYVLANEQTRWYAWLLIAEIKISNLHPFETLAHQCSTERRHAEGKPFLELFRTFWRTNSLPRQQYAKEFQARMAKKDSQTPREPKISAFLEKIGKPNDVVLRGLLTEGKWTEAFDLLLLGEHAVAPSK